MHQGVVAVDGVTCVYGDVLLRARMVRKLLRLAGRAKVPLDVTRQTVIRPADVARIRAESTPFREAVADQIDRYPRFQELGYTYLHDPLAVAMLLDPTLGRYEEMRIEVETGGRVSEGMTVPIIDPEGNNPVRVALDVDVARSEAFIVSRIAAA